MDAGPQGQPQPQPPTEPRFPWSLVPPPRPGELGRGSFSLAGRVLAGWSWPFFAALGRHPGPAVVVTAGVHGGEYPGILAARRLGRVIDPGRLHGALLILPIVNLPSFWERSAFTTPVDGRNLNRMFPGSPAGTWSEQLAFQLTQQVLAPADIVLDLHSGDVFETLAPHVVCWGSRDADIAVRSRGLAAAFGLPRVLTYPAPQNPRSLGAMAVALGKPSLLIEVGGNALATDDEVQTVFQGLVNTLRAAGAFEGPPSTPPAPRWLDPGPVLSAPVEGLWRPAVTLDQQVAPGDLLGILSDPHGDPLARLTAPEAGTVLYYLSALAARAGDPLVTLVRDAGP